jgi:hypothetical protein
MAQEDCRDNRSTQQENTRGEVPHARTATLTPRPRRAPNAPPHTLRLNSSAEQVIRGIPSSPPRLPIQETQSGAISEQLAPSLFSNDADSIGVMRGAINVGPAFNSLFNDEFLDGTINVGTTEEDVDTTEEEAERRRSGSDIAQAFLSESRRARRDTRGRRETTTSENL